MKTLLVGINTKYIHPNMAIRSLKANSSFEIDYVEYIIKDDVNKIIDFINNSKHEIIGLSCYIWNIELFNIIIPKIKNKILFLGGPEVSFDVAYFMERFKNVNFIISAEGETAVDELLYELHNEKNYRKVRNLSFRENDEIISNQILEEDLSNIKTNLYDIDFNQIVYLESSRGCPYNCSYCLSSLEKTLRVFDTEEVTSTIKDMINQGFKTFKFLDRSFNIDVDHAINVIDFIIKNHKPNNVFQLEISGDILDQRIIDFIHNNSPKGLFRFEIGIQSTNDLVTKEVKRKQDTKKLFEVIQNIQDFGVIDLHLDLIAGLPKEDLKSFKNTFNETIELRPLELQLGFLKMLRGTELRKNACVYDYVFSNEAPYEIYSNKYLSTQDVETIKRVEQVLEKYYNSPYFRNTIKHLLDYNNAFDLFNDFGLFFETKSKWINYNLHNLFEILESYIKLNSLDYENTLYLMIYDYLNYTKTKSKTWYNVNLDKKEINHILRTFFLEQTDYSLDDLFKYSKVVKVNNRIIIKVYKPNQNKIYTKEDLSWISTK